MGVMVTMRMMLVTFCILGKGTISLFGNAGPNDDDAKLETPELIRKYGYPEETHEVKTKDGYLLTMHRIPNKNATTKGPVLLQHGLVCSSIDYVIIGPGKALAYLLADAGYDVWMGNARGNVYSRKHISMMPTQKDFWQFSWHEIGLYDLPAMIDHILKEVPEKFDSLYYIGHSQGTTAFYVMASMLPQYNKKIRLMVNLSPVVFMSHLKSPTCRLLAPLGTLFKDSIEMVGGFELLPKSEFLSIISQQTCRDEAVTQAICSNFLFLISGFNSDQLNTTALPVILSHIPAGASSKQFLHYGQLVVSGKFRQYDRGFKNQAVYGRSTPPDYDLKKVTAPVALMYSTNDWLSDVKDVEKLNRILPNVVLKYKIPHPKFNHLDYLYAKDVYRLVYKKTMEIMLQY